MMLFSRTLDLPTVTEFDLALARWRFKHQKAHVPGHVKTLIREMVNNLCPKNEARFRLEMNGKVLFTRTKEYTLYFIKDSLECELEELIVVKTSDKRFAFYIGLRRVAVLMKI